jgi:hypothetical protein
MKNRQWPALKKNVKLFVETDSARDVHSSIQLQPVQQQCVHAQTKINKEDLSRGPSSRSIWTVDRSQQISHVIQHGD